MGTFREHAFERTIVQELQRYLLDRFVSSETPAKAALICEELPVADSQVPQEAFMQVFHRLTAWDAHHRTAMNKFRLVETTPEDALPFLKPTPKPETENANQDHGEKEEETRG